MTKNTYRLDFSKVSKAFIDTPEEERDVELEYYRGFASLNEFGHSEALSDLKSVLTAEEVPERGALNAALEKAFTAIELIELGNSAFTKTPFAQWKSIVQAQVEKGIAKPEHRAALLHNFQSRCIEFAERANPFNQTEAQQSRSFVTVNDNGTKMLLSMKAFQVWAKGNGLTGEQIEAVALYCHPNSALTTAENMSVAPRNMGSRIDKGGSYVVNIGRDAGGNAAAVKISSVSNIKGVNMNEDMDIVGGRWDGGVSTNEIDISTLKGKRFIPGFASKNMPAEYAISSYHDSLHCEMPAALRGKALTQEEHLQHSVDLFMAGYCVDHKDVGPDIGGVPSHLTAKDINDARLLQQVTSAIDASSSMQVQGKVVTHFCETLAPKIISTIAQQQNLNPKQVVQLNLAAVSDRHGEVALNYATPLITSASFDEEGKIDIVAASKLAMHAAFDKEGKVDLNRAEQVLHSVAERIADPAMKEMMNKKARRIAMQVTKDQGLSLNQDGSWVERMANTASNPLKGLDAHAFVKKTISVDRQEAAEPNISAVSPTTVIAPPVKASNVHVAVGRRSPAVDKMIGKHADRELKRKRAQEVSKDGVVDR